MAHYFGRFNYGASSPNAKTDGETFKEDPQTVGGIKRLHSTYPTELSPATPIYFSFLKSKRHTAMRFGGSFVAFVLATVLSVSHAIPVCHLSPLFFSLHTS